MNPEFVHLERLVEEFTPPWAEYRGCPRRFSDFIPPGEFYELLPTKPGPGGGFNPDLPFIEKHTLVCQQQTFEDALALEASKSFPTTPDELTAICIWAAMNQPKKT